MVKFYLIDADARPEIPEDADNRQRLILGLWGQGYTADQLQWRTMFMLFDLLCESVFSRPYFGLEDAGENGVVEKRLVGFKFALMRFQQSSKSSSEATEEISN